MFEARPTEIIVTASRTPEEQGDSAASVTIIDAKRDRAARRAAGRAAAAADPVGRHRHQRPGGIADRSPHPRRRGQSHLAVRRRHPRQRPGGRQHAALRTAQRRLGLADRGRARAAIGAVGIGSDRRRGRGRRDRPMPRPTRSLRRSGLVRLRRAARRDRRRSDDVSVAARCSAGSGATGIDSFDRRAATATAIATSRRGAGQLDRLSPALELGASGFALSGRQRVRRLRSRHLPPRRHARQQPQQARRRAALGRSSAKRRARGRGRLAGSLLGSSNRNLLDGDPVNRTTGIAVRRWAASSSIA